MRTFSKRSLAVSLLTVVVATTQGQAKDEVLKPIHERFAEAKGDEVPDFQRHVMPLMGKLGCNGRACHGSFQGRGGFRLSLFGYDFKGDHEALLEDGTDRVDLEDAVNSLILVKPTDESQHEGGKRYEEDSWHYHVIRRWIEAGAKSPNAAKLVKLEVSPAEIVFKKSGEQVQLSCVAVWDDGIREDVTPLCRFKSNDDLVAAIGEGGTVTSTEPGDTHLIISYDKAVIPVPAMQPVSALTGKNYPKVATPTKVDELVVQKLRKLGVVPSDVGTDAEFLRRVCLDMTGTLPSAKEVEQFLANKDPNKRSKKIDELLETPAYAAWWTTKLCDFTGNNDAQLNNASPMRGRPTQEWYDWIHKRVVENQPYDDLVEGIACSTSMKPDQSYKEFCKEMSDIYREDSGKSFADLDNMTYYWARQDFREIEARAIGFAYSFMGIRIQCAQCHKHPFDQWSKDDFHQFKNFFARVVAGRNGAPPEYRDEYNEMVEKLGLKGKRGNDLRRMLPDLLKDGKTIPFPATYNSSRMQRTRNPMGEYPVFDHAKLLGGDIVDVNKVDEPREALMAWLRDTDNPYFARAFVNRVWASYFNVGIVNPPDDLSLANPPSNKALLDYLADGFVESGFDMKWVHRTIANSRTYQLSWKPNDSNRSDLRNFSHAIPRRLPAEVAYDAMQLASASDERVAEMHASANGRAIAIPGAGYRNNRGRTSSYALSVFGRSTRDNNCDCDRSDEPTLLQTVYLQNDRDTLQLLDAKRGTWINQVAEQLNPKQAEKATGRKYDPKQVAKYRSQLNAEAQQLAKLKKKGADEATIAKMERRLQFRRKKLAELVPPKASPEKVAVAKEKVSDLINQAYLRTLSRYPTKDEIARSTSYIQEADDTVNGVRDLTWALINTKEFIVNH